jgi:hypothetical protein|tara:strand:+ start:2686 stop:4056 length:1371 start_codon:yes stop_codon:yes gene_type:complete
MRFHTGSYGKDTIENNSLVTNLLKYPEISKAMIRQFPQYSLTYFLEGTGRFAKEALIGDSAFKWSVLGRLNRPSTCTGTQVGTGAANASLVVEFVENYLNPNDIVRFKDGSQAILLDGGSPSAGGTSYIMKLQTNDVAATLATSNTAAGETANTAGSVFEEGSNKGFENHVFPDWHVNYLTTSRKAKSITGTALTDVTWIENNGQRLWYFTDQNLVMEEYLYQLELSRWYGRSTMDANGVSQVVDSKGSALISGDGLLAQIDSANTDTYSGDLTEDVIVDFIANLSLNSGKKNNQWMVFTGTAGKVAFHKAMRDLVFQGNSLIYDMDSGRNLELGVHYTTYNALGHRITLVHNPLFDDPQLHTDLDPISGYPKESYRMVFMDMGVSNGESNIEVKVKGAGGVDRGMIVKYIPGMVNPFDQKSMVASNAKDGFTCEVLSESGLIVRNTLSCGQLRKV